MPRQRAATLFVPTLALAGISLLVLAAVLAARPAPAAADYDFAWSGKIALEAEELQSDDPDRRLKAINALGVYSVEATRVYLLDALLDADQRVRFAAARILGKHQVTAATPIVVDWLDDPDTAVKEVAVQVLGDLASEDATTALIRTLGDIDDRVRREAVVALGNIGAAGPAAAATVAIPLISRIEDDKSEVRLAAVEQLQRLGDPRAVIPLISAFKDPAVSVRKAAIEAVGHLGDQTAVPALVRLLRDSDEELKVHAVTSLGNLAAADATDELIEQLAHGSDLYRSKVAYALGQIAKVANAANSPEAGPAGERAVNALVGALAVRSVRTGASEALRNAGEAAVPALIAHLEGAIEGDLEAAVALLRDIGDSRATPALVAELDRGRLGVDLLLDAIAAAGDQRALIPVLDLLSADEAAIRRRAMTALRPLLGDRRAADVLVGLLDDSDLEIRILAAEYLGLMRTTGAVPALIEHTTAGTEPRLRLASVDALGEIGDPRATPALLALLERGPRALHHAAASALVYVADPAAIDPLLALIADRKAPARHHAVRALGGVLRAGRDPAAMARARAVLAKLAREETTALSLAAMEALGAMSARAAPAEHGSAVATAIAPAVPVLVDIAESRGPHRRRAALTALGNLGARAGLRVLTEGLESGDDRVAGDAAWALGKLDDPAALAALVRATRRPGWARAINVSAALARRAGPDHVDALIPLLYHRIRFVRVNAAVGLGRLRAAVAVGPLSALLAGDPSPAVRIAAARALGQLATSDAARALREAADSERSRAVRDAIAHAQAEPWRPAARTDWRNFHFVEPGRDDAPVKQEPYFLHASDGLVTALYTDERGQWAEEQFPPGDYTLAPKSKSTQY